MNKQIISYEDFVNALSSLWKEYENEPSLDETLKLGIGIANSYKECVDLLWMGINPSCPNPDKGPIANPPFPSFEVTLSNPEIKGYWKTIKRIIGEIDCKKEHLDLFAIRKTPQDFLRKVGFDNEKNPTLHFLAKHLWYTQQFLENYLKPKVIILANKAAGAYLGLEPKFVWMGYRTEVISEMPCGKIHRIIGIRNEERLIRQTPYENQLDGTIILHARFQGNGCPKEQQINPNHIEGLLKLAGVN